MRFTPEQLDDLRARHPCDAVAGEWVKLRRKGNRSTGPCPMCSRDPAKKSATRFDAWADRWACAVCGDGGDVFRLMALYHGLDPKADFVKVVELLGGVRAVEETPETAKRRGRQAFAAGVRREAGAAEYAIERPAELVGHWRSGWDAGAKAERDAQFYRERERKRLYDNFWQRALPWSHADGPTQRYLALRLGHVPDAVAIAANVLRCHPAMPYFADGTEREPRVIHTGPTMLAPIIGVDGKFSGLHFTYLDLAQPKGKAVIIDPLNPDDAMPAKKVRGHKAAGRIELVRVREPSRLVMGEGIEKVLAVHGAMMRAGRAMDGVAFWTSVDLGNLGGKHLESVPHPTLKTPGGRVQRVPGPEPDIESPAIPIPDSVADLVLLGDSTSDRFLTECAMRRAAARYERPGRTVRIAWAPDGKDFDEVR